MNACNLPYLRFRRPFGSLKSSPFCFLFLINMGTHSYKMVKKDTLLCTFYCTKNCTIFCPEVFIMFRTRDLRVGRGILSEV